MQCLTGSKVSGPEIAAAQTAQLVDRPRCTLNSFCSVWIPSHTTHTHTHNQQCQSTEGIPKPHQRSINPNAATKMSPKVKTLADMYKLSSAVVTVLTCINLYVRRQVAYVIVKWPTTESGKLKISRPVPH